MRTMIRGFCFALAALLVVAGQPAAAQKKFVMKFGTATPRGDQNTWMARFKAAVEKRTNGRIEVKLFPSSQLGAIPRQHKRVFFQTLWTSRREAPPRKDKKVGFC